MHFPLLTCLIALPLIGAGVLLLLPREAESETRWGAMLVALLEAVLAAVLVAGYDASPGTPAMQFTERADWIPQFGVRYAVGVDGLSLFLVALTALLTPLAMGVSWSAVKDRQKEFYVVLLVMETSMVGVFAAADLFLFYVFWELMLVPMALLIGIWGGERRVYASIKFVLYTLVGSLPMLLAVLYCGRAAGTFDLAEMPRRLAEALAGGRIGVSAEVMCFAAFALAFAIKVPVFPLHTWLPDAHVEAPTAGSVLLAGVLLKMGIYGLLRVAIPLLPAALGARLPIGCNFVQLFQVLAVVGIVWGALMAMAQDDLKKLVAYSSVSHLGFCVLGVFALNARGIEGSVLQMINHGLSTGALFLLVGILYERTHTRLLRDYGGLAGIVPRCALVLVVTALASIGLPGLNGFPGEFLVLMGAFEVKRWAAAAAGLGIVLGAVYTLWMVRAVLFGKRTNPRNEGLPDLRPREWAVLLPLVVLFFGIGLFPGLIIDRMEPTVAGWVRDFAPARRHKPVVAGPERGGTETESATAKPPMNTRR